MKLGLSYTSHLIVADEHLAATLGSGDLEVLGTPAMLCLMENAAMQAVLEFLPSGSTTVGGRIEVSHLCPTKKGKSVSATATLIAVEGKRLTFTITSHEGDKLLGEGTHTRFIVERAQFMARLIE